MANGNQLPEGFVLDSQPLQQQTELPSGFVIDSPAPVAPTKPAGNGESPTDIFNRIRAGEKPAGNVFDAIVEPLTGVASNIAGESAERLVTAGNFLMGDSPVQASKNAAGIADNVSAFGQPQTQVGDYGLNKIGNFIQGGVDFANQTMGGLTSLATLATGGSIEYAQDILARVRDEGYLNVVGKEVLNKTGSPWLSSAAIQSPEIIGSLLPLTQIFKNRGAQTLPDQELAQRIMAGDTSGELAKYVVDGAGKLKFDISAQKAIDAGIDPGLMSAIKGLPEPEGIGVLSPSMRPEMNPTKKKMIQMLEIKRKGQKDQFYADENRPGDVVGDAALKRFNLIKRVNKKAGGEIDKQAKKLKGKIVDFSQPINTFIASLESLGVKFNPDLTLDFKGSDIEGLPAPMNALNKIVDRLKVGDTGDIPDAYDLHRLKRYIDEVVSYGKGAEGLTGRAEGVVKQLRSNVDDVLDGNFPDYDKANTSYAQTIDVINEFQQVAGQRMDLSGKNADRAVGVLMRRILSNAQSGANVLSSIEKLDDVSRAYGGKFDDNIRMMVSFNNQLDKIFGSSASTSFQSEITSGILNSINKAADGRSVKRKAVDYITNKLTPGEADAFDTLRKAIEGKTDDWRG